MDWSLTLPSSNRAQQGITLVALAVQVCKYTPNSRCRLSIASCLLAVLLQCMFLDNSSL